MYEQYTLFEQNLRTPLADNVRPQTLNDYVGQQHLLGKGMPLRLAIENDNITSMLLWGPPGVGKTTLAKIIASSTKSIFKSISAVTSGIKDIKSIFEEATANRYMGKKTILFIDEIHRFNRSQQDVLLPYVENGTIVLIGATTENPSFEINSALLSRLTVYTLNTLNKTDIITILNNAINVLTKNSPNAIAIEEDCLNIIADYSNGDARSALNLLDNILSLYTGSSIITADYINQVFQNQLPIYSRNGDEHYNMISALHKSMRNSDYNAALYWLSRMLDSGENPTYIARRLIRFASEDIGLADPNALQQATLAFEASRYIGLPECDVNLAQAVVYLSLAPKSNSLYTAIESSKDIAKKTRQEVVPFHLRNASTSLMANLGYGAGYIYAHDTETKTSNMNCMPNNLKQLQFYYPSDQGNEIQVSERIKSLQQQKTETST